MSHASRTPTTGCRFMKIAARLAPTRCTPSYHHTCAIAPRTPWMATTLQATGEPQSGAGKNRAVMKGTGSSISEPRT